MASAASGKAQGIEAARTLASVMRRSGDGWWSALDGRQLTPTSLADGSPLLGTARVILAATSLARGYHDRRWVATDKADGLGYGPYRGERPTVIPVAQGETTTPEDVAYVAMLNAEQLRGAHGGGMRAGSPVTPEKPETPDRSATIDAVARTAMNLVGGRTLVARIPDTWDARRAGRLLEAGALASMLYQPQAPRSPDLDAVEAIALTANLATAMALSDLGVPPACARTGSVPAREIALRWAEAILRDPGNLFACTARAERLAAKLVKATSDALAAMASEDGDPASQPSVTRDALGCEPTGNGEGRPTDGKTLMTATVDADTYTLRSVAEESRLASKALAGIRDMGR